MGRMAEKDGWQISDSLWKKIQPLLPVPLPNPHPLGGHRPRVDERLAMNAIVFVLRTGCQQGVGDGVDLGAKPAARAAQSLSLGVALRRPCRVRVGTDERGVDKHAL